jgi:hypothetical protein
MMNDDCIALFMDYSYERKSYSTEDTWIFY